MREILFRAKRIDNKEWVEGYYSKHCGYNYLSYNTSNKDFENYIISEKVLPETIGQFTGLTDINGKKIFEHDKLKDNKGQIGTIFYSETAAAFLVNWKMKDGSFETDACFYGEVIGNIHEEVTE